MMPKRRLSQEALKAIACVSMLLDHIGATIVVDCFYRATGLEKALLAEAYNILHTIGRLAFPIYAFLLVEGTSHTKNPKRYGLRLLIGAILSEIPYDLAFYGSIDWNENSVMITLLLGFVMLMAMNKVPHQWMKPLLVLPVAFAAEKLGTDYGARGIMVIAAFAFTRELPRKHLLQALLLWFIFSPDHLMMLNWLNGFRITAREWAVLAVVPIALYGGQKVTKSKVLQWGFYLFYPVHLLVLYLMPTI